MVKKFRIFFDKDAENEWLNKMSAAGYQLVDFKGGRYTFEEGEKGKYLYMADLIDRANFNLEAYKKPLAKVGIDVIAHFGNYVYIRKLAETGPFVIDRPVEDQLAQYNRIGTMLLIMMFIEFVAGVIELIGGILTGDSLPLTIGVILIVLGCFFLRLVMRIVKKMKKLDGRYDKK